MLFEQKFLYIYSAYFLFEFLLKFGFFSKECLFKRTVEKKFERTKFERKNEFQKNVIRSKDLVPYVHGLK